MDRRLLRSRRGDAMSLRTILLQALLAASLILNIYLLFFKGNTPLPLPVVDGNVLEGLTNSGDSTPAMDGPEVLAGSSGVVEDAKPPVVENYKRLSLKVSGSVARTFGTALGSEVGDVVSAHFSRVFMWKLGLKSDVRPDDELTLVYALRDDGQVDIPVASYKSLKHRTTYKAYHFQQAGRKYRHFYDENGVEVAERLVNSPIDEYEQVTSLLKDRPTHKGIDFKSPVGSPIKSPFRGRITRINWARKYNGNCIEVVFADGVIGKFLHLDKVKPGLKAGATVGAGEVIAYSGNTGRSTAPHLHYQLEKRNGKILDPFIVQETYHLKLEAEELASFKGTLADLDAQLDGNAPLVGAAD